jgi:hypothetical protein
MIPARRTSHALRAWLAALLLTACQHSMTASLGGGTSATPTAAPSTAPAQTAEASQEPGAGPTGDTAILIGTTVEEATRLAREKGYTGNLDITTLREFQAGCKPARVCAVRPRLWELLPGSMLTLYVNPELKITTPN